ncbi:P-loop containing nucleoside triphosphate hydrolase protein [Mycena haematopus]|nr:P-loop containing nucleoside triphosphate hydrolase protein [Mycena haematopus]
MPQITSWTSPEGEAALKTIVASEIPAWTNGLRDRQTQPILRILDGQDVLLCTATGDGKSALFMVPIICHLTISKSPDRFPKFARIRKHPVGVIITPTKGLARNIVESLAKHNISALAYDRETIISAASQHRNLQEELTSCQFRIVCVDPEHLRSSSWLKIFDAPTFRQNLIFVNVEEIHLVREWVIFRQSYGFVGQFLRGRLPPDISVSGLSATLEPGIPTTEICQSLGFRDFHLFRFSNERLDVQFVLEPLQNAVSSRSFPQLLPYLNAGRNVVIYVQSLEISTRLYLYLLRMDPSGQTGRRIRQYNSLCHPEFNSETLQLMETDPEMQIIISTVALANGIHSPTIDDVIMLQMPKTLSQTEQQGGRASRLADATGRAVILVQKSDIKNAKKFMASIASAPENPPTAPQQSHGRKKQAKSPAEQMDPAKAEFLVEMTCLNAVRNRRWQNEPLLETDRDCIAAKRPLPCSLCAARANIMVTFPRRDFCRPPFPIPSATKRSPVPRGTKLKKKERPTVIERLGEFNTQIFEKEMYNTAYQNRVKSWFFPTSLQEKLADVLMRLATAADIDALLRTQNWPFRSSPYQDELWALVTQIQAAIRSARNVAAATSKKRRGRGKATDLDEMEAVEVTEMGSRRSTRHRPTTVNTASAPVSRASSPLPQPSNTRSSQRKRALDDITNERVVKPRTTDKRTLKELQAEFGPVRTSYRRAPAS